MRRVFEQVIGAGAAAGLSAALLSGCGGGAPSLETPNNTPAVAVNNVDYAGTIGKQAITQTIRVTIPPSVTLGHSQTFDLWNYTNSMVKPSEVKDVIHYLTADVADGEQTQELDLDYDDGTTTSNLRLKTGAVISTDREHDMLLVPYNSPATGNLDTNTNTGNVNAQTIDFGNSIDTPTVSETVSVVPQPQDSNEDLEPFTGPDNGTWTEACQATVSAIPFTDSLGQQYDINVVQNLAQETWCNSEGLLITAILLGMTYDQYVGFMGQQTDVTVPGDPAEDGAGNTYTINDFTISLKQYRITQRQLAEAA